MDKTIETTKNLILDEVDKITAKGQLTMNDLDVLHKLSETLYYMGHAETGSGYSMDGPDDIYSRSDRSGRRSGTSYGGRSYDYMPQRY